MMLGPSPTARASFTGRSAFPGVWQRWQDARPTGGFDAVIGNPPWDHIEQPGGGVVCSSATTRWRWQSTGAARQGDDSAATAPGR